MKNITGWADSLPVIATDHLRFPGTGRSMRLIDLLVNANWVMRVAGSGVLFSFPVSSVLMAGTHHHPPHPPLCRVMNWFISVCLFVWLSCPFHSIYYLSCGLEHQTNGFKGQKVNCNDEKSWRALRGRTKGRETCTPGAWWRALRRWTDMTNTAESPGRRPHRRNPDINQRWGEGDLPSSGLPHGSSALLSRLLSPSLELCRRETLHVGHVHIYPWVTIPAPAILQGVVIA